MRIMMLSFLTAFTLVACGGEEAPAPAADDAAPAAADDAGGDAEAEADEAEGGDAEEGDEDAAAEEGDGEEGDAEEELYFDAETGQLVVKSRSNELVVSQDHLPATQMAEEGFFL